MVQRKRAICPACGETKSLLERSALVAPWIRELAQISYRHCRYHVCSCCRSGWVDLEFSEGELHRIYGNYRGSHYLRIRNKWEPSYSDNLNQSLNQGDEIFRTRRRELERVIDTIDSRIRDSVKFVLDIGGGHGSLIPDWPSIERKVVIDVSGVEVEEGIESIRDWSELRGRCEIQLVLNCMVLEHLNDPKAFLVQLRQEFLSYAIFPERTLFYFEVPYGVPFRRSLPFRSQLLRLASRNQGVWSHLDRVIIRNPQKWPLRIAEHIQFFTGDGLSELLKQSGFDPILVTSFEVNHALEDSAGIRFSGTHAAVARIT